MSDEQYKPRPNQIVAQPATVAACNADYTAAQDRKAEEAAHAFGISIDPGEPDNG